MIYEPSDDSYLLEKYVKKYAKKGMKVLDVGVGGGILSLAAKKKGSKVLACDINPQAVNLCKQKEIDCVLSDLFKEIDGKFDLIIFNPPYLPEDQREDAESKTITTGGKYGYEILKRFFKEAREHLRRQGRILIVISSLTKPQKVEEIIINNGFKFRELERENLFFEELVVYSVKFPKDL